LDRNIELTSDDEEKSKLKSLRASVTDVGKQVVAGLMVEFVKGNIHF
jgi:Na+/melibiose symporter-like transporter